MYGLPFRKHMLLELITYSPISQRRPDPHVFQENITINLAMPAFHGSSKYSYTVSNKLTNKELQSLLKSYSLPTNGVQADLRGRLQQKYLDWKNPSLEDIKIVRDFFTKMMTKKKLLKELTKRGLNGRFDHKVEDLRRILTIYEMERGIF